MTISGMSTDGRYPIDGGFAGEARGEKKPACHITFS
jgi:hypothetical protein